MGIHSGLVRRNATKILKSILPQSFAIAGVFCLFSLVGSFLGQLISLLLPVSARTPAVLFISALSAIFLVTPLTIGIRRWCWRLSGGADDSLRTVFYAFGDGRAYHRALRFSVQYHLRLYAVQLVALPRFFLEYTKLSQTQLLMQDSLAELFTAGASLLELVGLLFSFWLSLRYFLAPYLMANDEQLSPSQALRLSFKIMKGRSKRLLSFYLSFIGWGLLCVLILPILYVLPLFWIGGGLFARYLIADYNTDYIKGDTTYA